MKQPLLSKRLAMETILGPTKNLIKLLKYTNDIVDLSNAKFMHPVELLPIAALISENSKNYIKPKNENCSSYLNYFNFPNGLTKPNQPSSKYIPIYKFSASGKDDKSLRDKSVILESLIAICLSKLGSPEGSVSALNLAIDEIISNIEDHSEAEFGWINARFYPSKKYLDVCMLDRGITIAGKYKKIGIKYNDLEALKNAIEGKSTKPEKTRGSGLRTFVSMINNGFNGEIVIISGNAISYASKAVKPVVEKISVYWKGTIVTFRIPKTHETIDYTKYID